MHLLRFCTLAWPGLPWLWLRGSLGGLVLAVAFAVVFDTAVVTTCVWSELVDLRVAVGLWTAAAAIWTVATISAFSAFPPPLATSTSAATERLFVEARDAYLRRDWIAAETNLGALLAMRPTDGEAQLLLATLLRRLGRENEARRALERLARSDSGLRWQAEIAREQTLLDRGTTAAADGADEADSDADRLRPAA